MSKRDSEKRYYWRCRSDFFQRYDIDLMLAQKFGKDCLLIYMRLISEACVHGGMLAYNKQRPYTMDELKHRTGGYRTFNQCFEYLVDNGLVEIDEQGYIYIEYADIMSGSETGRTERKRVKNLHQEGEDFAPSGCNSSTITTTTTKTIDITKDIDITTTTTKDKYSGGRSPIFNKLSDDEVAMLEERFYDHWELIDAVNDEVYLSNTQVKNPYSYIVGYAKKVGWSAK